MAEQQQENTYYRLWFMVQRFYSVLSKLRAKELNDLGVSLDNIKLLHNINRLGREATPSRLAKDTYLKHPTVTQAINRLVQQGLVIKVNDLPRKNMVRLQLTEKGEQVNQASRDMADVSKIFSELSAEERSAFRSIIAKMTTSAMNLFYEDTVKTRFLD